MKISQRARKTMPESWQNLFDTAKKWRWSKYFEEQGYRCTAYEPEHDQRGVVQVAKRRHHGASYSHFQGFERFFYGDLLDKEDYLLEIVFVTGAYLHGGMYIYDHIEMAKTGAFDETVPRGVNLYYEVPLEHMVKICNVWDLPHYVHGDALFKCAAWQYQDMTTRKANTGKCSYDSVKTWQDLDDWCMWKWMEVDGTIIKGREEEFCKFVEKAKKDARYIPTIYEKLSMENQKDE